MNIDQLAGIELRKVYWEKKGWNIRHQPYIGAWDDPDAMCWRVYSVRNKCKGTVDTKAEALALLPPVESSIEVAMGALEEFCEKLSDEREGVHIAWEVRTAGPNEKFCCLIADDVASQEWFDYGTTPAEAITRCLIKAMEKV